MRVPPSNSRGLSALGISGEDEEKQQHFCHCSSPFYSAACVGALLSVALFGCSFSMVRILAIIAFTRFDFQNLPVSIKQTGLPNPSTTAWVLVVFSVYCPFFAPALCGCALIEVLSMLRFSKSASSFKASKI